MLQTTHCRLLMSNRFSGLVASPIWGEKKQPAATVREPLPVLPQQDIGGNTI